LKFEDYQRPAVAVDVILFRMVNITKGNRKEDTKSLQVALIKRDIQDVENGKWSLPGCFVDIDMTMMDTIYSKISEKIGTNDFKVDQLYVVDNIARDDRWRVISSVYIGFLDNDACFSNNNVKWFDVHDTYLSDPEDGVILRAEELAFDHAKMLERALSTMRSGIFKSDLAFRFLSDEFTLRDMKTVCETISGKKIDNFQRRVKNIVVESGNIYKGKACRPAKLFKRRDEENYE